MLVNRKSFVADVWFCLHTVMAKDVWWLRNLSALPIKVQLCCIKPLAKFNFQETWALSSSKTLLDLSTRTAEQFHCRLPVSLGAYRVSLLLGT